MNNIYHQAAFFQSANEPHTLPPEFGFEVAFAGRSNSGKSSTINTLCQQKSLARTSKTPGRTQLINFFSLPEGKYIVDLPGYGYAKVPEKVKLKWQAFIESYLQNRFTLRGIVIIMDIRRPFQEHDTLLLSWAEKRKLPVHVVLNKMDKINFGPAKAELFKAQKKLKSYDIDTSCQLFSALKKKGTEELQEQLNLWLYNDNENNN